jgi:hypothetical protein
VDLLRNFSEDRARVLDQGENLGCLLLWIRIALGKEFKTTWKKSKDLSDIKKLRTML